MSISLFAATRLVAGVRGTRACKQAERSAVHEDDGGGAVGGGVADASRLPPNCKPVLRDRELCLSFQLGRVRYTLGHVKTLRESQLPLPLGGHSDYTSCDC